MFQSSGMLYYEWSGRLSPPWKLVLNIDPGIADFYFALIPKADRARKQAFPAHISVVRKELGTRARDCKRYKGQEVPFEYDPTILNDDTYYWLDAYSTQLEAIRTELGLHNAPLYPAPWHRPMPEGTNYTRRFHITIGNVKPIAT